MFHAFEISTHRISLSIALAVALAAAFALPVSVQARGDFGGGGLRGGGYGAGGVQRSGMGASPSSLGPGMQIPRSSIDPDAFHRDSAFNVYGSDWGWGGDGAWGADNLGVSPSSGLIGAGPSSFTYSLPFGCDVYENCNGAYYQPVYLGNTVGYQAYLPY